MQLIVEILVEPNVGEFERRHGATHAEMVKKQWKALGIGPGPWMMVVWRRSAPPSLVEVYLAPRSYERFLPLLISEDDPVGQ